ncbi:MAG: hypothetical protein JSS82_15580 [Bacteroidetes bacterium]|nr:hypothetical protein [Bacteroidota bacterium]
MFAPDPARGIGSLPSPKRTLAGGLGQAVTTSGKVIGDLSMNQGRKGLDASLVNRELGDLPGTYRDLYNKVSNPRSMVAPKDYVRLIGGGAEADSQYMPQHPEMTDLLNRLSSGPSARHPNFQGAADGLPLDEWRKLDLQSRFQGAIPDPRSGYNSKQITDAVYARSRGMDPTSEEYAALLTGRKIAPPVPNQPIPQDIPEELTATALSLPESDFYPVSKEPRDRSAFYPVADQGLQMQTPQFDDAVPNPSAGDFYPVANNGLENPFADPRPSLTREDIDNSIFYPVPQQPRDRSQFYPVPDGFLARGSGDPNNPSGYDMLRDQFGRGISNKQVRDEMRMRQWRQDDRDMGFGSAMTGVNNIVSGLAPSRRGRNGTRTADHGLRDFLDGQNDNYMTQAQNTRKSRYNEQGQQFNEDKYYGDLLNENDPGSVANQAKLGNAIAALRNAESAAQNAQTRQELDRARAEWFAARDDIEMLKAKVKQQEAGIKRDDVESKIQDRAGKRVETARHNQQTEQNTRRGQDVSRDNNIRTTTTTQRGQDIGRENNIRNNNTAQRGQDVSRDNNIRNNFTSQRGQDVSRQNNQNTNETSIKRAQMQSDTAHDKLQASMGAVDPKSGKFKYSDATRSQYGVKLNPQDPAHRAQMIKYMQMANGDKAKALQLAQRDGW